MIPARETPARFLIRSLSSRRIFNLSLTPDMLFAPARATAEPFIPDFPVMIVGVVGFHRQFQFLGPLAKQCRIIEVSCRQCVLKSLSLILLPAQMGLSREEKPEALRTPGKRANMPFAPLCPVIASLRHLSNFTWLPTPR